MPATEAPEGYPLALPPEQILLDEPGHRWDLEEAVRKATSVLFEDPIRSCRRQSRFWARGRSGSTYASSSSRTTSPVTPRAGARPHSTGTCRSPPASGGSGSTRPRSRARACSPLPGRLRAGKGICRETVTRLQGDLGGATGTSARKLASQLEAEETLGEELRAFRIEANRIAALGWEPDLDDGIILCAAPLSDLFPAWSDAAKERVNLRKGAYPWASVSEFAERL